MTKTFGHLDKSLPNSSEFSLKVEVAKFFPWNSQMLAETCALAKDFSSGGKNINIGLFSTRNDQIIAKHSVWMGITNMSTLRAFPGAKRALRQTF